MYLQTYILSHLSENDLQRMAVASKRLCELSSQVRRRALSPSAQCLEVYLLKTTISGVAVVLV
jgi:hypothetical protein